MKSSLARPIARKPFELVCECNVEVKLLHYLLEVQLDEDLKTIFCLVLGHEGKYSKESKVS